MLEGRGRVLGATAGGLLLFRLSSCDICLPGVCLLDRAPPTSVVPLTELLLAAEVSVVGVLLSVLDTLLGLGGGVVGAADDDLERCSTSVVKAST